MPAEWTAKLLLLVWRWVRGIALDRVPDVLVLLCARFAERAWPQALPVPPNTAAGGCAAVPFEASIVLSAAQRLKVGRLLPWASRPCSPVWGGEAEFPGDGADGPVCGVARTRPSASAALLPPQTRGWQCPRPCRGPGPCS